MPLSQALVERVLEGLGLDRLPQPDHTGLGRVYDAWCRRVPFDNVLKRIHIASGSPAPLPGDAPAEFFETWLRHGVGGTCWAGNGALAELLRALGFTAERGVATMMVGPDPTPNHGTVIVHLEDGACLVDASILHGEPLPLRTSETAIEHPAWGVRTALDGPTRFVHWLPFHTRMACRIDAETASTDEFRERHEKTRGWSPFNHSLSARLNRGEEVIGAAFGQRGHIDAEGRPTLRPFEGDERTRLLVDEMGLSEAIVAALPSDEPMPPPPR
jgi:N-hydroxyarylamine O-acetyltransferase